MRGVWRSTVTTGIVAAVAGGSAALPATAFAMTPVVRTTCDRIDLTYSPYDINAVVVTVDSTVHLTTNFGDSFVGSVDLPEATTAHRWRVHVTTSGDPVSRRDRSLCRAASSRAGLLLRLRTVPRDSGSSACGCSA